MRSERLIARATRRLHRAAGAGRFLAAQYSTSMSFSAAGICPSGPCSCMSFMRSPGHAELAAHVRGHARSSFLESATAVS